MSRFSLVVASALLLLVPSCDTVGGIVDSLYPAGVGIASVEITEIEHDAVTLTFGVDVDNPYSVPLPVARLGYALSSDGKQLFDGRVTETIVVPAKKSRIVPLTARIPFADALAALSGVRPGDVVPYTATFDVALEVPGGELQAFPISRSGTFPIPAVPRVSVRKLDLDHQGTIQDLLDGKRTLGTVRGRILLDVENVNDFPVDLTAMRYALNVGGREIAKLGSKELLRFGPHDSDDLELEFALDGASLTMDAFRAIASQSDTVELAGTMELDSSFGAMSLPFRGRLQSSGGR